MMSLPERPLKKFVGCARRDRHSRAGGCRREARARACSAWREDRRRAPSERHLAGAEARTDRARPCPAADLAVRPAGRTAADSRCAALAAAEAAPAAAEARTPAAEVTCWGGGCCGANCCCGAACAGGALAAIACVFTGPLLRELRLGGRCLRRRRRLGRRRLGRRRIERRCGIGCGGACCACAGAAWCWGGGGCACGPFAARLSECTRLSDEATASSAWFTAG